MLTTTIKNQERGVSYGYYYTGFWGNVSSKREEILTKLQSKITTSKFKKKFAEPKKNIPPIKRGKKTGLFHAFLYGSRCGICRRYQLIMRAQG